MDLLQIILLHITQKNYFLKVRQKIVIFVPNFHLLDFNEEVKMEISHLGEKKKYKNKVTSFPETLPPPSPVPGINSDLSF
jgi:hypothetical protein